MARDPGAGAELASSRFFPFPPSQLYDAFADPHKLARWWGPHGATNTFHEFDLRPGGRWRLTMAGPRGNVEMDKTFVAVEPGRRVCVRHAQEGHTFTLEMEFQPAPGGTRLVWKTTFATPQQLAAVREPFAKANEENFDRLEALLRQGSND